jgi:GLPGLI family protein
MKKILFSMGMLFSLLSHAQMKEGKIIYERTMTLQARNFNNIDPNIAAQIPRTRTESYELLFSNGQSLYQFLPSAASDDGGTVSGGGFVMRFAGGSNDIVYHNFEKGTKVEQRELMDRSFVISDSIRQGSWKLTDETKTILNYTAKKAVSQRISTRNQMTMENGEMKRTEIPDTAQVIAWFTTDIPVSVGPEMQGQLPGAILELDINKGLLVYKAVEISPKVNMKNIKEPKDGKRITAAEFVKEREKMMEEMRRNMPAGNTIRIQN